MEESHDRAQLKGRSAKTVLADHVLVDPLCNESLFKTRHN
jgi:hypothetical protein